MSEGVLLYVEVLSKDVVMMILKSAACRVGHGGGVARYPEGL